MRTRAQDYLVLAERMVSQVAEEEAQVQKIYGGLCHSFPILVRTSGLCQALAFSKDKATVTEGMRSPRSRAHELLLDHVRQVLGLPGGDALAAVSEAELATYMVYTRRILAAWLYFKRFAVSILKVRSAQEAEGER